MKKEKGITLIALIVTIIILIILATVSINVIWNDNGIIKKAQKAGKLQETAQVKERLELAILAVQADILEDSTREELPSLSDITTESVSKKLEKDMSISIGSTEESSDGKSQKIATVETNGKTYQFIIKEDLSIEILDENEVTLSYTFTSYIKSDGTSIDVNLEFTCKNGINNIEFPDGTVQDEPNSTIVTKAGVTLQLNTEYTYTITTSDGTVKKKTIIIKPKDLPVP